MSTSNLDIATFDHLHPSERLEAWSLLFVRSFHYRADTRLVAQSCCSKSPPLLGSRQHRKTIRTLRGPNGTYPHFSHRSICSISTQCCAESPHHRVNSLTAVHASIVMTLMLLALVVEQAAVLLWCVSVRWCGVESLCLGRHCEFEALETSPGI